MKDGKAFCKDCAKEKASTLALKRSFDKEAV